MDKETEHRLWVKLFTIDYGHDKWLLWLMLNELYYEEQVLKDNG